MSDNYSAVRLFDDGVAAYIREDFKTGIKQFSQALKEDRRFAPAYAGRGAAYLRINKIQKAISDFTSAIRLMPRDARSFHLRGLAYEKAGEIARAYRDFDRAIEIDPDLTAAYRSRDAVLDKEIEDREAMEDPELIDHLTSMRVTLLRHEKKAA